MQVSPIALVPEEKFKPLHIEPRGQVKIRSNGLQRALAIGSGLAILAVVITPWFFLGWKMCLAIHVAASALLGFVNTRSENRYSRHYNYIDHAKSMIRPMIDDLRYEENAAEMKEALVIAQDMVNIRLTERRDPFMVEILASRFAWLLKALQEIEAQHRVTPDALYILKYVTSPITKRQILSYCFGRMPVRTLEQNLFYGRYPGGSAAT